MMIRSTVGKQRVWASVLAVSFGLALIAVACQTSPPQGEDLTGAAAGISAAEIEELSADPRAFRERLGAAIEAGEMTGEEARALWTETYGDREAGGSEASDRELIAQARTEMARAVEAGEITQEQADERMRGLLARLRGGERTAEGGESDSIERERAIRERLAAYGAELAKAVEAGEMTREEAGKKWEEAMARLRRDGGGGGR